MASRRDLLRHQRQCGDETRVCFDEVKSMIQRLEDKMETRIAELKSDIASRHAENRAAIQQLWKALIFALVALTGFLVWAAEHGGLAGIVNGKF